MKDKGGAGRPVGSDFSHFSERDGGLDQDRGARGERVGFWAEVEPAGLLQRGVRGVEGHLGFWPEQLKGGSSF